MAIRTPVFMSRFLCLEKVALNMSAVVWSSSGVPYFRSSACIWSSPVALLLLKLLKLFLTSSGVIGFFSGFGSPSNGVFSSAVSSSNLLLKCEETMSSTLLYNNLCIPNLKENTTCFFTGMLVIWATSVLETMV